MVTREPNVPNKKMFIKKKAFQATWDESDDNDHEDDDSQDPPKCASWLLKMR